VLCFHQSTTPTKGTLLEILPDLDRLTDEEKADLIARLEVEEGTTSVRRRVLHVRIDHLRKEYEERVKLRIAEGQELPILEPKDLDRPLFEGTGDLPAEHDLGPLPDLASLSDAALRDLIHELEVEEDDVSFHRRVLQGHLDIVRSYTPGDPLDVASLAKMLSSGRPGGSEAA
jgi:hypothetical protein